MGRPFAVHTVVSEEDGGLGAFATMLRGHTGDAAVITEPTSGRIVTANAGALTFALTVPGRAAHGSMRLEGVNALDAFLPIYRRLRELETERNAHPDPLFRDLPLPYPISVGRVTAGDWASSVRTSSWQKDDWACSWGKTRQRREPHSKPPLPM